MTALEVRNKLATALAGLLGTYTLPNSTVIPALYVTPPQVPNNWKVLGIECTLAQSAAQKTDPISWISGTDGLYIEQYHTVTLLQHDLTGTLGVAVNAVMLAFPISKVVATPQNNDAYERAVITITDRVFYHT
jgi:hypothetical protein